MFSGNVTMSIQKQAVKAFIEKALIEEDWDRLYDLLTREDTPASCHIHLLEVLLDPEQYGAPVGLGYAAGATFVGLIQKALHCPDIPSPLISQACLFPNPIVRNLAVQHPACTEEAKVIVALLR